MPAGAQCGASGAHAGRGGGSRVGWDFPGPQPSGAGLGLKGEPRPGLDRGPWTWVRATHHQAGRASGWGTVPEGRARAPVRARPKGRAPSPAADEPLLSSLPAPPGFTVTSAQPGEGKQQLPKTPGTSSWHPPSHPSPLRSCSQSLWLPAAEGGRTGPSSAPGGGGHAVKLQLCVALGKSLLSEP